MCADPLATESASQLVREAEAMLITAGAGIGVDSGLPDFRGVEGFWRAYPPLAKLGISFEEMADPVWFQRDPELAWAFYGHRLNLYRRTIPHRGFSRLLEIARHKNENYFVFTSNVDGQFQKAGFSPDRIVECHGSIHHLQCSRPCSSRIWEASGVQIQVDESRFRAAGPLPVCPTCRSLARPNILMFGDWDWIAERCQRQLDRYNVWLKEIEDSQQNLAVLEIGAGRAVPTIRIQSERISRRSHSKLIRINPRDSDLPGPGHAALPLGALEAIEKIYAACTESA